MKSPKVRFWSAVLTIFLLYWAYHFVFWTSCDTTLPPGTEQQQGDALGIYATAKLSLESHRHPLGVAKTLWGPLPLYINNLGLQLFGQHLSSIRKIMSPFSGLWGAALFLIANVCGLGLVSSLLLSTSLLPFSLNLNAEANRGYAHFYSYLILAYVLFFLLRFARDKRKGWLIAAGVALGLSFGFKYEHALVGLAATVAALAALGVVEDVSRGKAFTQSKQALFSQGRGLVWISLALVSMLVSFKLSLFGPLFVVFWLACFALAGLSILATQIPQPNLREFRKRIEPYLFLLVPAVAMLGILLVQLYTSAGSTTASTYLGYMIHPLQHLELVAPNTEAFSESQTAYFLRIHPLLYWKFSLWLIIFAVVGLSLRSKLSPMLRGLIIAVLLFCLFWIFAEPQIDLFSLTYFLWATACAAWVVFFLSQRDKSSVGLPQRQLAISLGVCSVGSLALLRESGSLDLAVWPMLPGLIAILSLPLAYGKALQTFVASVIFYFALTAWSGVEAENIANCKLGSGTPLARVDDEFDLKLPLATAEALRDMKAYLAQSLLADEYLFIVSEHFYPYVLSPSSAPVLPSYLFQIPTATEEQEILQLFDTKKIKLIALSDGVPAFNSKRAVQRFPRVGQLIADRYAPTGKHFLNFVFYQKKNRQQPH